MVKKAGFIDNPRIVLSEYALVPADVAHFDAVADCMSM
jgi:hypothetical protein